MIKVDWSDAPEGATHYFHGSSTPWRDLSGEKWKWFSGNSWHCSGSPSSEMMDDYSDRMTEKPSITWNGEGLPPVGTVCEIRAHKLNEWSAAEIKFASRNVLVWDWVDEPAVNGLCTAYTHDVEIRPIRTPEQIAAEEQFSAYKGMIDDLSAAIGLSNIDSRECDVLHALAAAGWRKQEAK